MLDNLVNDREKGTNMQDAQLEHTQVWDKVFPQTALLGRRAFLQGLALLTLGLAGCQEREPKADDEFEPDSGADYGVSGPEAGEDAQSTGGAEPSLGEPAGGEAEPMQISVTINGTSFTATIEDTQAGKALLTRLPLVLQMEELHGNEKYCYTGEDFGGEQQVPDTIEAGDLMVFGSDCLVLFYETFANGGWSYARVGRIDDPSGLAEACGSGTATVTFEPIA